MMKGFNRFRSLILLLGCFLIVLFALGMDFHVPSALRHHETDDPLVPKTPPVKRHDVYELKERLTDLGFYQGAVNETYDKETVEAVKRFQKSYWLEPDGIVEINTWKALAVGVSRPLQSVTSVVPEGEVYLEVDTETAILTVFISGEVWKTYPVAVGKWATLTPVGEWKITEKGFETGGAFGTRWMALDVPWGGYGIHGTNRPWSIGTYASLGCVRMFNEDVEELFDFVPIGTKVRILGHRPLLDFGRSFGSGTIGPEVVRLQEALREFGFDTGPTDGRYGPKTSEAVRDIGEVFGLGRQDWASRDLFVLLNVEGQ